jgi:sulfur carrier protein
MNTVVTPQGEITIAVNGEPASTTARTLHDWVLAQGATPESLATAVNGQFVPRTLRAATVLHMGDAILTFQPITGG